jgi:predicted RNA-binding protein YlxR (DUF448 family)
LVEAALAAADADDEEMTGPSRRCLVTGEVRPKAELVRFVLDPAGHVVPDLAGKLPGRGLWLTARRDIVADAAGKRVFVRAAKAPAVVPAGLEDRVEALLVQRCIETLGLARRAGLAVAGFVRVKTALIDGEIALLVEATDAAADGQGKLAALASGLPRVMCLTGRELGGAFGREHAVHVALKKGRIADLLIAEARRLSGFRPTCRVIDAKVDVSDR